MAEKDKFKEEIRRSLEHNQAMWGRLENDVGHLSAQQQGLKSRMLKMESRLAEMDGQIGKSPYF